MSGTYRLQLLFQANDQEDYNKRKGLSDGITTEIAETIAARTGGLSGADLDLQALQATSVHCRDVALRDAEVIGFRAASGEDFGLYESPAIDAINSSKRVWTEFATDLVVYARQVRGGDLTAVPFLEAKSISDEPQVYYPFAA